MTPSPPPYTARQQAVAQAVQARHGAAAQVTSVIVEGSSAVALGTAHGAKLKDGLRLEGSQWRITCELGSTPADSRILVRRCGFPQNDAVMLAAQAAAETAISRGDFSAATAAEARAYRAASGPQIDDERARLQLLRRLNEQMRTGAITRADAIRQWSQFRLTWSLP